MVPTKKTFVFGSEFKFAYDEVWFLVCCQLWKSDDSIELNTV